MAQVLLSILSCLLEAEMSFTRQILIILGMILSNGKQWITGMNRIPEAIEKHRLHRQPIRLPSSLLMMLRQPTVKQRRL